MAIIYPSTAISPQNNKLTVSPRTLAQHHCSPPPNTSEKLIEWTNTIRKRHLKYFAKLQFDRKELELYKERSRGYKDSVLGDKVREEKEAEEMRLKEEEMERERDRLRKLEERREMLLEELADEPEVGEDGVITIALRFTDGGANKGSSSDRRRFIASETTMNNVFNWIDAKFGIERERLELSTMNGQKTFRYNAEEEEDDEDETLEEIGLGKMTALRVTEISLDEGEEDEEGEENDSSDDGESEDEYDSDDEE